MNKSGTAGQVIRHPQGGGAIKGIGDTFSPDLHTGTGNLTVPIAIPAGRNQLQPELSLVYSTGHGNGPFGLGWVLSVPGVTRDTRRGFPTFVDEEDTFLLSGSEQLVPVRPAPDGATTYQPRTEGLFARITHRFSVHDDYWEVRSRSGLVSLYGSPGARGADAAVVRDPDDPARAFAWSLTATTDTFGNRIEYLYEREAVAEDGPHRWDQIYLKTIRYVDHGPRDSLRFLVTVDFEYEPRPDPFSSYRAGFEIRTTRRCARIEVRTDADTTRLTRAYRLVYQDRLDTSAMPANGVSLLRRIEVEGVDGEAREALPPLDFGYTGFDPSGRVYRPLAADGAAVPERSLAHPDFELADLFGRGLPDVVQIGDVSRYWRNLGDGRFDLPLPLEALPPGVRLGDRGIQLADVDGDGHIDLLVSQRALSGYAPLTAARASEAEPFVSYDAAPTFALDDPEVRLMDLDGDGIADALRTGAAFELHYHDRKLGWTRAESRARGEFDSFPDVWFSDPRVKLADMSGDGSQDIVLVGSGSVDYWPYLGHGRWGRRVAMRGRLEFPDSVGYGGIGFDPRRLLLGDVDGDGLADLVYVESGRVTIWLNQSGNGWSEPIVVRGTPPVAEADAVRLADMLGLGTDGILWSYDNRTFADSGYKYLDLAGGAKPYLLVERDNNTGARTRVEYAPSTRFYLEDERDPATRWRGRLPFPVQVVARVEVVDELSGGKVTSEYRYHQGYWDGEEREFRGFGMVEQLDTETFARYHAEGLHGPTAFAPVDHVHFSPPTLTRTWFHQGQVQDEDGDWRESGPRQAPWAGDRGMLTAELRGELVAIARAAALEADPVRLRHALRALQGSVLRSELYALDESPRRDRPYTVTESLHDVREVERGAAGQLGVFFPFQVASRTTQWERGDDPMTQFAFTGGHDEYGLPRTQLAVAVPRGRDPVAAGDGALEPYLSTWAVTEYARRDDADRYIVDRVARKTSYEVLNDGRPTVLALREAVAAGAAELRLIGHGRSFYDGEAFVGLPLGRLGDWGVVVRTEELAFTDAFLDALYDPADPRSASPRPCWLSPGVPVSWTPEYPAEFRAMLPPLAGYAHYAEGAVPGSPGGYYVISSRRRYDVHDSDDGRGLSRVARDPLGADTSIEYDAYALFPTRVVDPAGLEMSASYDYRALQASRITDTNGNSVEFEFSPSGFLATQSVRGKYGEGDAATPSVRMEYDLLAFAERREPICIRTVSRVHHDTETDVPPEQRAATIEAVEYSDGLGRLLQTRAQAENTLFGDPLSGGADLAADQSAPVGAAVGRPRAPGQGPNVVVSGWQRYDNKGRVTDKYDPFFSQGWSFGAPAEASLGRKTVHFYDARGRVERTLNPDGSEQCVLTGMPVDLANPSVHAPSAWESFTYDVNDNAGRTHPGSSSKYASHWNTPSSVTVDVLGRTVLAVVRNGADEATEWFATRSGYDIQGNLLTVVDPLGREALRCVFDLAGRRWRVDSIDAGRRDVVPDVLGRPLEERDSKGALRLHCADVLRRPNRLWARDSASGVLTLRQRADYGDGGRPDQPPHERAAARSSNLLGQLVRHHDEAGLTTVRAMDFKGNVLDQSRRFIADAPILSVFDGAPAASWQITPFQVDWEPASQQSLADLESELLESTDYRTSAVYDALGHVTALRLPMDVEGRRPILRAEYNGAGGLRSILLDDTVYVERIAYDANGQRMLVAYGNGVMTRYAYDPQRLWLRRLRSERYTMAGEATYVPTGAALQDLGYDYDLAGNVLAICERTTGSGVPHNPEAAATDDPVLAQLLVTGDALTRRFTYDPLYRLVAATGRECDQPPDGPPWLDAPRCADPTRARAYTEDYHYDPVGTMLRLEHRSGAAGFVRHFTPEAGSNRLRSMQIGASVFTYASDANGNTRSEATARHFEWDHADRLRAFRTQTDGAEPSVYAQYLYDSSGRRAKKVVRRQGGRVEIRNYVGNVFEHHRWDSGANAGENNCIQVMDADRRAALVRVGPARAGDTAPAVQFELADHLGSSSAVVDAVGALVGREEYTPYGETSFGSVSRKRFRFAGVERDDESGLVHCGARSYTCATCTWLSPDPAGPVDGLNLFRYARSSPISYSDASGYEAEPAVQPALTDADLLELSRRDPIYVNGLIPFDEGEFWRKYTENETICSPLCPGWFTPNRYTVAESMYYWSRQPDEAHPERARRQWDLYKQHVQVLRESDEAAQFESWARSANGAMQFLAVAAIVSITGAIAVWAPAADLVVVGAPAAAPTAEAAVMGAIGTGVGFWIEMEKGHDESAGVAPVAATTQTTKDAFYVYRLVGTDGDTLYYGKTNDPQTRLDAHVRGPLGSLIAGMEVFAGPMGEAQALASEQIHIQTSESWGQHLFNVDDAPFRNSKYSRYAAPTDLDYSSRKKSIRFFPRGRR